MRTQTCTEGRPREDTGRGRRPHAQEGGSGGPALPTPGSWGPAYGTGDINRCCMTPPTPKSVVLFTAAELTPSVWDWACACTHECMNGQTRWGREGSGGKCPSGWCPVWGRSRPTVTSRRSPGNPPLSHHILGFPRITGTLLDQE